MIEPTSPDAAPATPENRAETSAETPRHDAVTLFRGGDRAVVIHRGVQYLLRATRNDKLILTK